MKVALDTNVLVYAEGLDDVRRESIAARFLAVLPSQDTYLPAQVLGELFNVLVRKGVPSPRAAEVAREWGEVYRLIETSAELMLTAIDLASRHHFRVWDALILSAAAEAECAMLLSEDFQDGFTFKGVTVCNPFAASLHPLAADLLGES